ncbi:hypothetical protein AAFX28_14005 [Vibrio sp. TBV020]
MTKSQKSKLEHLRCKHWGVTPEQRTNALLRVYCAKRGVVCL